MNKMKMYDPALLSALKNADNFMLCAHINPDGDALGSMLALGRLLRKMGKTALMVCPDPIPTHLMWLPDIGLIRPVEALESVPLGAAFCVDVSEPKRLGSAWEYYRQAPVRFMVDHHPGTGELAHYALIDPQMPAAGQMVFALWQELGMALDSEAAAQLYAAISTDTGNFCFNSVQPETFGCMEELLRVGFDLSEASRRLFLVRTRGGAQALGRVLSSLKFFAGGRATCMHLSAADKAACQAADGDLHGMVNQGLNIEGVCMTFMADETPDGWKISLRALPGGDVESIARQFAGGGHRLASGCVIPGDYETVERKLMAAITQALEA